MEINEKDYRYRIEPRFGKVYAEIYYIWKPNEIEHEINLISKSFKKWFKPIQDSDYKDAKGWCETHIKNIYINRQGS